MSRISSKGDLQPLGIKKSLVYQSLAYTHCYGVPYNLHAWKLGHCCSLSQEDLKLVAVLLNCRHCIYLNNLSFKAWGITNLSASKEHTKESDANYGP